jgi:L-lactate dehydrogenase (cytochrome)
VQGISAAASFPLSDILLEKEMMNQEINGSMGMVYQVYLEYDRSRTEERVREAVDGGVQSVFASFFRGSCTDSVPRALILTVDSNVGDHRQSTEKMKGTRGSAEPGIKMGTFTDTSQYHDARQNWDDLAQGGLPHRREPTSRLSVGSAS